MLSKLVDRFDALMVRRERKKLPLLDWEPLVNELIPIIEDHSVFLETRFDGFVTVEAFQTGAADAEIVAVAVALVRDGLEPWDTEAPAQAMAGKLSKCLGRPVPRLLSRQWKVFAGHYARVSG